MKILLLNPKNKVWSGGTSTLPVGLAYIAASLEQDKHEVKCIDLDVEPADGLEAEIAASELVGITAVTATIKSAWELGRLAKRHGKTVVIGGPHATVLPEESLLAGFADIVVRGEGEETIKEIAAKKELAAIAGISYINGGKVVNNPQRAQIADLDTLPFPARHLFKLKLYKSEFHSKNIIATVHTSRGCPHKCNFCCRDVFGNTYRMRSVENVVKEWDMLVSQGVEELNINDDNFTAVPSRGIEICDRLIKNKLNVPWTASGGLRVDKVTKELLVKMKESGCYRVSLGAESGSQAIIDKIGKRITLQQIRDAVRLCKEAGLESTVFFMIGNLGETEKDIRATIEFAKELEPSFAQFTIAVPYPGTALYDYVKKNGRLLVDDWSQYGSFTGKAYFECGSLTKGLVERMIKKAYREYYLRPRILMKLLLKYNVKLFKTLSLFR